jgi:RNA polymerase sigma factor (sigma-70 family)
MPLAGGSAVSQGSRLRSRERLRKGEPDTGLAERGAPASFEWPVKPEFVDVYDAHIWDVYGYLAYRVDSREEAEDLTQGTFERALRAWGRFDPGRATPRTWLLSIAHNLLIDHYRAARARPVTVAEHLTTERDHGVQEGPEHDLGLSPELATALETLAQRDREVVALRFGGQLTGPEIAGMLGLSLANVQQILSRSLRRLRAELEAD